MGELDQRRWRVKYEERRKQAERLRGLVKAQREAIEADTALANDVIERERTRARRYR